MQVEGSFAVAIGCIVIRSFACAALLSPFFPSSLPLQDVESLVVTMHAIFEDSFMRGEDLWADYLVPPGPAPISVRTSEWTFFLGGRGGGGGGFGGGGGGGLLLGHRVRGHRDSHHSRTRTSTHQHQDD
jgi:hypothetical protein